MAEKCPPPLTPQDLCGSHWWLKKELGGVEIFLKPFWDDPKLDRIEVIFQDSPPALHPSTPLPRHLQAGRLWQKVCIKEQFHSSDTFLSMDFSGRSSHHAMSFANCLKYNVAIFLIRQRHCHVSGDLNVHPQNGRKQVKIEKLIDWKHGWIHKVPHLFGTYAPPAGWKTHRNRRLADVTDFCILHVFNLRFVSSLYIFWISCTPSGRSKRLHLFYKKASIEICLGFSQSIAMFQVPSMPWCDVGCFL